jgi:hypothetical protein
MDSVSGWTNTTSVETLARSLMLDLILADTPNDAPAIEGAVNELAATSPSSTATWQALAATRKANGGSMEGVVAAFRMSSLTGSHEGFFMMRRAIFGLENWSDLPEQDRRTVVRDMLGSFREDGEAQTRYREILAAKSSPERDSIRTAILDSGLASKDVLKALGV